MIITTNKSIRDWTELLAGDEVLATAILDRLLHRAHVLSAAKGNQPAQRMLLDFVGEVEGARRRELQQFFEVLVLSKQRGEEQIAWARLRGLPAPVLVPHPDHLIIDPMAGSVKLRGPYTPEEKVEWDEFTAMKADLRKRLAEVEAERRAAPRSRSLKNQIETLRSVIARIDARLNFERVLVEGFY